MGIPGEDLKGSFPATVFVGWYNGHPDYQSFTFDLSCERVAVVGNGNVAVDVARILARDPSTLEDTDISDGALKVLKQSTVKEIVMLGRRGAAQAQFTNPEIREMCDLPGSDLVIDPEEIDLDEFRELCTMIARVSQKVPLILQPISGEVEGHEDSELMRLLGELQTIGLGMLGDVRIVPRLHKILKIR